MATRPSLRNGALLFNIPPCSGSDIHYSDLTGEGPKPREVMLLVQGHTANWSLPLWNAGRKG